MTQTRRARATAFTLTCVVLVSLGVVLAPAASAAVVADYRFQGTLASSTPGAGPLTELGEVPTAFNTERVNGASRRVLQFACNAGVQAPIGNLPNDSYSIAVLFRFADTAGYNRIVDFKNGVGDNGLYVLGGALNFYPLITGPTVQFEEGRYSQVVLTRTAAGSVTGYVDGVEAFTFDDAGGLAVIDDADVLRFFRDNDGGGGPTTEASSGGVARIRLFDTPLSAAEVAGLDDTPAPASEDSAEGVGCDTTPPVPEPDTPRIEGDGSSDVRRVAIQVCEFLFERPDEARSVVLARNDVFADALAGSPLAGNDSCVLYTTGGADASLDPATAAEIDRVLPPGGPVRILGGPSAVSPSVEQQLRGAGYAVERLSGPSRFETAVAVARVVRRERPGGTDAMLAFGRNFPDAVTGGAYGALTGTPILLTESNELPATTADAFAELGVRRTFVLGGTGVISDAVAAQAPAPQRISGPNRMATAARVAAELWPAVSPVVTTVILCNIERDDGWALTLAAAPLSARDGAPQLGVGTDTYPAETQAFIRGQDPRLGTAYVMGNEEFISDAVAAAVSADVGD